jgi:hypothetical protein
VTYHARVLMPFALPPRALASLAAVATEGLPSTLSTPAVKPAATPSARG